MTARNAQGLVKGNKGQTLRARVMRQHWQQGQAATRRYKQRLAELVAPGMRLLHAGCGWDSKEVSRPFKDSCTVVGVDLDPRVQPLFHSEFHLGSLTDLPFEADSFDLLFSEYVLEHVTEPTAAFREMARVLKPGQRMLMLTPSLWSYKSLASRVTPHSLHLWAGRVRYGRGHEEDMYPTVYRANTARQLRRLAQASQLELVSLEYVTNGPTWFVKFPVVFELFHLYHLAIQRWDWTKALRCAIIMELRKPAAG